MARIDGRITVCSVNNGVPEYDRFSITFRHGGQATKQPRWQGTYKWKRIDEWSIGLVTCALYQHRTQHHYRIDLQKEDAPGGMGSFSVIEYKSTAGMERAWVNIRENVLAALVVHGAGWATDYIKTTSYSGNNK